MSGDGRGRGKHHPTNPFGKCPMLWEALQVEQLISSIHLQSDRAVFLALHPFFQKSPGRLPHFAAIIRLPPTLSIFSSSLLLLLFFSLLLHCALGPFPFIATHCKNEEPGIPSRIPSDFETPLACFQHRIFSLPSLRVPILCVKLVYCLVALSSPPPLALTSDELLSPLPFVGPRPINLLSSSRGPQTLASRHPILSFDLCHRTQHLYLNGVSFALRERTALGPRLL